MTDRIAYLQNKSSDDYFYFNPIVILESGTSSEFVSFKVCHIQRLLNLNVGRFDSETYISFHGMRTYYAVKKTMVRRCMSSYQATF